MSSLAVIATFYRRPWALSRIARALRVQTRQPDEIIVPCERMEDLDVAFDALHGMERTRLWVLRDPPYGVNPLGRVINDALDRTDADYITYLTDDSLPHPHKYEYMARALDENPEWGAVYCSQDFGTVGSPEEWLAAEWGGANVRRADVPEPSPFCRVDHTQVMHRRSAARWPLSYGDRRLSDAHFFRDLVDEVGPLMPVPEVLDWTRQLPDGLSNR